MIDTIQSVKPKRMLATGEIYEILRKEILELKLAPGQALSEIQMSGRFNISRTPIRSVFAYLERDGLVEIRPQKGTYVSLIDLDIAEQTIFIRIQLELAAMRHLARHPNLSLFNQLEKNLEQQKQQIIEGVIDTDFLRADSQFHELCIASIGKRKAWQMIQNMEVHYKRYRLIDYHHEDVYKTLHQEHSALYHLMKEGNVEQINSTLTSHLYGGILRFDTALFDEHGHLFTESERTIKELVRDVKLTINESYSG